jgi:hypothetical protein
LSPVDGSPLVTSFNLQGLLDRLGVRGLYRFFLRDTIQPVAVVDGSIQALGLQALDIPFTAGELTNPAVNTRLATTGPLAAGQYNLTIHASWSTDANAIRIRRRNAGDTSDIWSMRYAARQDGVGVGTLFFNFTLRVILAATERVVVEIPIGSTVTAIYQASIWVQGPF